jgi:hypothetical protein
LLGNCYIRHSLPIITLKKPILYLLLAVAIAGCKKDAPKTPVTPVVIKPDPGTPKDTAFQFKLLAKYNTGKFTGDSVSLTVQGDSVIGVIPTQSDEKSFVLSFLPASANVKIGNVIQQSGITANDFRMPVMYTYVDKKGVSKTYKVALSNFTGIPVLTLTTAGPVVSEDVYITGSLQINTNGQYDPVPSPIDLQIKGRGNSTWGMPKKSYRLKFNTKAPMLGLPAAKSWVLLANYSDKTLIRNAVALEMGRQFSSNYANHTRFVEVVMNGEYLGSYTLTEQVEVNDGRVSITELKPKNTSAAEITGGYLLELDQRLGEPSYFYSNSGLPFCIKSPDAITDGQMTYIHDYVQQTEDAIFADNFADPINGYAKYIDVDSFINWYLVKEIMKDNDALDFSSIYYYKERGGKLGMGPLWDFDLAGGNTDYSDCQYPTGWWVRNMKWFNRLFQDPAFQAKVRARFNQLKLTAIPNIYASIDRDAAYLKLSQKQNFYKWDILGTYVWPNVVVLGSYPAEVEYLNTWMHNRIAWMDLNL